MSSGGPPEGRSDGNKNPATGDSKEDSTEQPQAPETSSRDSQAAGGGTAANPQFNESSQAKQGEEQPTKSTQKPEKQAAQPTADKEQQSHPTNPTDPHAVLLSAFSSITGNPTPRLPELSPETQEKLSTTLSNLTGQADPSKVLDNLPPDKKDYITRTLSSFNPGDPESRNAIVSTISYVTGKLPQGAADQIKAEIDKAAASPGNFIDAAVASVTDAIGSWFDAADTERPSAGGVPYKPLGDLDKHAHDNTVVSALGGTLGGLTRTLGGTVGALGSGVGNTVTNVGSGGKKGQAQEGQTEGEGGDEGAEAKPQKKGVGQSISGGGQSITDATNWTARAMENTTKGYPVQWQDLTGNDRRL
ncbi:MAG: hypothetical protein Q9162_003934 [Coniocarpon cinnabarinum]